MAASTTTITVVTVVAAAGRCAIISATCLSGACHVPRMLQRCHHGQVLADVFDHHLFAHLHLC